MGPQRHQAGMYGRQSAMMAGLPGTAQAAAGVGAQQQFDNQNAQFNQQLQTQQMGAQAQGLGSIAQLAALLYANHGQVGHGIQAQTKDSNERFAAGQPRSFRHDPTMSDAQGGLYSNGVVDPQDPRLMLLMHFLNLSRGNPGFGGRPPQNDFTAPGRY